MPDVAIAATIAPLPPAPGGRIAAERRVTQAELRVARYLLSNYQAFRLQLADLQADAVHGGYGIAYDTQQRSGGVSDPTQQRALMLAQSGEVQALQRRVRSVAWTLAELPELARRLVLLRYEKRRQWPEIATALNVGTRTARLWDERIATRVAERMREGVAA